MDFFQTADDLRALHEKYSVPQPEYDEIKEWAWKHARPNCAKGWTVYAQLYNYGDVKVVEVWASDKPVYPRAPFTQECGWYNLRVNAQVAVALIEGVFRNKMRTP